MRPRKKDRHLPPCVHFRHGAYYLVKGGKWTRLANTLPDALAAYARKFSAPSGRFGSLVDTALTSMRPKLSSGTWEQYQMAARKLKRGFAEFSPEEIKPKHIAAMKMELAGTPNAFNTALSVLRVIFDYAVEMQILESNPAISIKRLEEKKRKRLISRAEYEAIYAQATPQLQVIMDLLYLTGQRVMDVIRIKHSDLREEGIYFEQAKTKARLVVAWTPEIRSVVDRARTLYGNLRAISLLHARNGKALAYHAVLDSWLQSCKRAGVDDAQLRDLRAMAITATRAQGQDATALAGHVNPEMTERYIRDRQVPVVQGPSFGQVLDVGRKGTKK